MADLDAPLGDDELAKLDAWLMSEDSPEECMDISMLHGFMAAVVSGPMVMPGEWLPVVWGPGEGPQFRTARTAERALSWIMRLYNEVAGALATDPHRFEPLLYENRLAIRQLRSRTSGATATCAG